MLRLEQSNFLEKPKEASYSANDKGSKGKSQQKSSGRWTKEEHQRFVDGLKKFGKNWKCIEDHVGTRNGAQVRSHAQKYFNKLGKDGLPNFEDANLQIVKNSDEILRKTSGSSLDTNDSDQDNENQESESPVQEKLKADLPNSNLAEKLAATMSSNENLKIWENAELVQRKEIVNDLSVTSFSLFNLLMSKFKSCNNQVVLPRLSDIVQISTNIQKRFPLSDIDSARKNALSIQSSFRLHQSNILKSDGTPTRTLDRLRNPSSDNSPRQDEVVKKVKVN